MRGAFAVMLVLTLGTALAGFAQEEPSEEPGVIEESIQPAEMTQGPPFAILGPELVAFPGGVEGLGGWFWWPEGQGPFPAVLYNHGSERLPGDKATVARVFVTEGYVFFVPHRRGHGRSPGPYIGDQQLAAPPANRNQVQVQLLEEQVEDQMAALAYLKQLPSVDPVRIAVTGCSYGGIQTILGAERDVGYRAAVNFAGAAQSWGNSLLRERLVRAVQQIRIPTFLLQAENDYSIEPSLTLAREFERLGKAHQIRIYPPYGTTRDDGHAGFCFEGGDVWGSDVLSFLAKAMGQ